MVSPNDVQARAQLSGRSRPEEAGCPSVGPVQTLAKEDRPLSPGGACILLRASVNGSGGCCRAKQRPQGRGGLSRVADERFVIWRSFKIPCSYLLKRLSKRLSKYLFCTDFDGFDGWRLGGSSTSSSVRGVRSRAMAGSCVVQEPEAGARRELFGVVPDSGESLRFRPHPGPAPLAEWGGAQRRVRLQRKQSSERGVT